MPTTKPMARTAPPKASKRPGDAHIITDGAGIEWKLEILDRTTGAYRKTRITAAAPTPLSRPKAIVREGVDESLITEVPPDQNAVYFMASWLIKMRLNNGFRAAREKLDAQFPMTSEEDRERAARMYAR